MRVLGIVFAAIAVLIVLFWENLKGYAISFWALLGLCTSCNQKGAAPTSATGSVKIDSAGATIGQTEYTTQIPEVNEDNPNAVCEVFTNHTAATPHLYANTYQNQLVGTVLAMSQPEFNAYGTWKNMQKVGRQIDNPNYFMWAYRENFNYATNVNLRTREGCSSYADVRSTHPYAYQGRTVNLPNIGAIANYEDLNLVLNISSDIPDERAEYDTYAIEVAGHHSNLIFRINGGGWIGTSLQTQEEFTGRIHNFTLCPFFTSGKDFIIDFSKNGGATIDRFKVIRNQAGGHFAVTSTFVRVRDGRAFVHTFQADKFTPMNLSGIPYKTWGCWFDLGIKTPGNYVYQLKGETGYILDEGLYVQIF